MALRLSTGLAIALAGKGVNILAFGNDFTFTASSKRIASASYQFAGVLVGDTVLVKGSLNNANKAGKVTAVAADGAYIEIDGTLVDEAAGNSAAVSCYSAGMPLTEALRYGIIAVYTGTQPNSADDAETGTLLGYYTLAGGAFIPGVNTNGLLLANAVAGTLNGVPGALIGLHSSMTNVKCTPIASGTAGWVRFYDNAMVTGASTSAKRLDMACGVGTGEFRLSSQTFTIGVDVALNSVSLLQRLTA